MEMPRWTDIEIALIRQPAIYGWANLIPPAGFRKFFIVYGIRGDSVPLILGLKFTRLESYANFGYQVSFVFFTVLKMPQV